MTTDGYIVLYAQCLSCNVVQRAHGSGKVERAVLEGEARRVRLDERHVRKLALRTSPAGGEHLGHDVHRHDLPYERGHREGESARARADVEDALVARRLEKAASLCTQLFATALLVLDHALYGRGEPRLRRFSVLCV